MSGRFGFDYRLDNDTLLYGFYARGFKPGGFNPAIPPAFQATSAFTFDSEEVDSLEFGAKSVLFDGRLLLNASAFISDYTGLQVTRIKNNSSINENIDANLMGLELEGVWRPEAMPQLSVDFAYGWLSSSVDGSMSVDPINRTGGNADYVLLNNIDPGSSTAVNYVAREAQITNGVVLAALESGAALDVRNGLTQGSVSYSENAAGVSIPAYFSRNFLTAMGVETLEGVLVDLDGNQLPNSPDHTLRARPLPHLDRQRRRHADGAVGLVLAERLLRPRVQHAGRCDRVLEPAQRHGDLRARQHHDQALGAERAQRRQCHGQVRHIRHLRFLPQLLPDGAAHLRRFVPDGLRRLRLLPIKAVRD